MSREDDLDDIMDSPDEVDAGQDDTSEPLLEESLDESPVEDVDEAEVVSFTAEASEPEEEMPAPARPARKPAAKKKKKAAAKPKAKAKTRPKPKAKKKAAKPSRKPAARKTAKKKTAKKTAKKKTRPAAKKKKAARKR